MRKIKKTKNIFNHDIYFIVDEENERYIQVAGVGNLIKCYPSDCECSSSQIAAVEILNLDETKIRKIHRFSNGGCSREGSWEDEITQDYLDDLILYGYDMKYQDDQTVFIKLKNTDYDISVNHDGGHYLYVRNWRDGHVRGNDKHELKVNSMQDAILMALANEF